VWFVFWGFVAFLAICGHAVCSGIRDREKSGPRDFFVKRKK
jgi:hypothetical protein